jgi:hypothetical protein
MTQIKQNKKIIIIQKQCIRFNRGLGWTFLTFTAYRFGGHFKNTLNKHQFTNNKTNMHYAWLLSCPTNVLDPLYLKDKFSTEKDSDV